MSAFYLFLAWAFGCVSPFLFWAALECIEDCAAQLSRWLWRKRNHGKWHIHSHAGGGSDYSNGGRYTIYRVGYWGPPYDSAHFGQWVRWEPPMKTEADALAECDRLNDSQFAQPSNTIATP